MAQTPLELQIVEALEARAAERGIDVVDVEVVGAKRAPIVRVRIDHADEELPTISLDEVSAQSDWVHEVIDELDPFPGSFMLAVSSPGLARPRIPTGAGLVRRPYQLAPLKLSSTMRFLILPPVR